MVIIQEDTVRQLHLKQGKTEIRVGRDAYVTQQARDYIREKGLALLVEGAEPPAPENKEIRPDEKAKAGLYAGLDGAVYDWKPEHMTHLYGNTLVPKNHPRIILRGKLDSLQAQIICLQVRADEKKRRELVRDLGETLDFCRAALSSEVSGKPMEAMKLLGMNEAELRHVSQHPKERLGVGHLLPSYQMGEFFAGLNLLRTLSREAELAAIEAFLTPQGTQRQDLIQGLNRLSSAFYIMMCRCADRNE